MSSPSEAERLRVLGIAQADGEFVADVDGFVYWWPERKGHLTAVQLRWLADELDRRNAKLEQQIEKELGNGKT